MKLGWMRAGNARRLSGPENRDAIVQADALGMRQIHLPDLDLDDVSQLPKTSHTRIGVSIGVDPRRSPRKLERCLRHALDRLDGRLVLAVEADTSPKSFIVSQTIETLTTATPSPLVTTDFPMHAPRPEVLSIPQIGQAPDMRRASAHGFHCLSPAWQTRADISRHWPEIVAGATHALRRARPSTWHVARCVFVSDDRNEVAAYCAGVAALYLNHGITTGTDPASLVIAGPATDVAAKLMELRARVGPFGVLQCLDPGLEAREGICQRERLVRQVLPALAPAIHFNEKELERT
ncbi:hypothetical protein N9L47_11140 [Rhodobacteraceae bacterium]|nr:hypothetical protein [Paracoccaceae bacterium]